MKNNPQRKPEIEASSIDSVPDMLVYPCLPRNRIPRKVKFGYLREDLGRSSPVDAGVADFRLGSPPLRGQRLYINLGLMNGAEAVIVGIIQEGFFEEGLLAIKASVDLTDLGEPTLTGIWTATLTTKPGWDLFIVYPVGLIRLQRQKIRSVDHARAAGKRARR